MTKEIKLYGTINEGGWNNAEAFVSEIEYWKRQGYDIVILMHCSGGDCFEGNVIAGAISKAKATIKIEGLAASMGAFILPYARRVEMADNAFIMLHEPRTIFGGTAEELEKQAKLLKSLTADFVKKLIKKTGKDEATVKSWLDGENWYSAEEAKEMGLIDEIIDPVFPVSEIAAFRETGKSSVIAKFIADLKKKEGDTNFIIDMNKTEIISKLGLTGVTSESHDDQIVAAIVASVEQERLKNEALQAELEACKDAEIEASVAHAIEAGKIDRSKHDEFAAIGKKIGAEALEKAFAAIITSPKQTVTGAIRQHTVVASDRSNWTFFDWSKNDPQGLKKIKQEDPELYAELAKTIKN